MKAHEDGNRKARIVRAIADFEQRLARHRGGRRNRQVVKCSHTEESHNRE